MNGPLTAILGLACLLGALPVPAADLRHRSGISGEGSLRIAVVLAVPADPKNALRARPPADAVDQVDKQFVPYVKPVFVGSKVRFPNSDKIRHQVYSFSPAKKFELPLYGGTDAPPVVFDKPGIIVLGCNIHDWMVGIHLWSETPFFAKTGSGGHGGHRGSAAGRVHRAGMAPGNGIVGRVDGAPHHRGRQWRGRRVAGQPQAHLPRAPRLGRASAGYP